MIYYHRQFHRIAISPFFLAVVLALAVESPRSLDYPAVALAIVLLVAEYCFAASEAAAAWAVAVVEVFVASIVLEKIFVAFLALLFDCFSVKFIQIY